MLIDLHAMTRASEPGGHDPTKIIERAREAGLDGIAFVERLRSSHAKDLLQAGEETEHKIILPVWHKISADQIREYSPTLADRVAVSTETGLDNVVREIKTATTYIETPNENPIAQKPRIRSASNILNNIVHAGPIQPDGGLMPASVKVVEELVERWNKNGYLNLMAKVEPMSREYRKSLFNTDKSVFLFPGCGMHQVRIEVIDKSYQTIGMIWTPPNVNDNDYHKALGFFLQEMGFLQKDGHV